MRFSAYREISQTPKATTIVSIGSLNRDWKLYGQVEIIWRSGRVLAVAPSACAVKERRVDDLIQCAIAYHNGGVQEIERRKQSSWGIAPDLIFYEVKDETGVITSTNPKSNRV